MKKTQFGATILEGSDIADLPLVSRNAQILEDEILKDRSKLEDKVDKVSGKGLSTNDFTNSNKKAIETDIPNKINVLNGELDTVKQSGVESNKILVDNLASKGVITSTSNTIRENVEKVKDIKLGSGNAKRTDVLQGKTYSSDEGTELVGTMPNRGNLNKVINLKDYEDLVGKQTVLTVDKGYYSGGKIEVERVYDDNTGSPGNKMIQIGNKDEGYFGVVSASQLITGNELTNRVGVTQGTAHYSSTPWHKFAWKGKILFIAQNTIRHDISWAHLNDKKVVDGSKVITIDGIKYHIRLINGVIFKNNDYVPMGSEWNRLVIPLSQTRKNEDWEFPHYVEDDLRDWNTYLTNKQLSVGLITGGYTWCKESHSLNTSRAYIRGSRDVSAIGSSPKSDTFYYNSWRPVLEVVQ